MRLAYRIVDVFSSRPLAGNGLCVVLDACPPELMAPIGREVNLSETTFPSVTGDDTFDVRIFTPSVELPFAGHPTLGTAWTLGPKRWTQTSPGATVVVEADFTSARMIQPVPSFTELDAAQAVAALGLPGAEGCWLAEAGGMGHVVVATEAPIGNVTPDLAAVARFADGVGGGGTFAVVRRRDDVTLHVRVFVPGAGISEDPGTGSAAGPIAMLAHRRWGTAKAVTIHQGDEIGRPCRIEVDVSDAAPVVGGAVVACAEGHFTL